MRVQLHTEVTTPIATVRLDKAGSPSALDPAGWRALADTFEALSDREDVACVVVCGLGSSAFERPSTDSSGSIAGPSPRDEALRAIQRCQRPTVALIEGHCSGEGLEIAACCDLRVCGESSRFAATVATRRRDAIRDGLDPVTGLVGSGPLLEQLLELESVGAERARTLGLVSRVYPDLTVAEHGYGLAARIAAGAPLVNRWHKRMLQRLLDPAPVSDEERESVYTELSSADFDEDRRAFLDDDPRLRIN